MVVVLVQRSGGGVGDVKTCLYNVVSQLSFSFFIFFIKVLIKYLKLLFLSFFLCLSLSLCVCVSLSLSLCLTISLSLSLRFCLSVSQMLTVFDTQTT